MEQTIEKRMKESISDKDFQRFLGKNVKNKIYVYADLEHYSFNKLLPKKLDYVIILIEDKINHGHWVCLTKDSYNKIVTWFDSYGIKPAGELKWVSAKQNAKLDNQPYDILNILHEAIKQGYTVLYNKKRFQKSDPNINCCGRHVIFYLLNFLKNNMNLPEYIEKMEFLEKQYKTDPDHLVTQFII